ncbi:unnamed protein product [Vitrella brassicaformis CCMP3155]|uniref:Uncharacterized protein n=2 Tax=Vitrella brassicaformis TaxID=1169539 RepID=A0A0G4F2K1_VITBC|nr:unnamed protein product [Vitrella brassicaformis CCMP3155]|eukprot:CEM05605.1 unnamed protein product [Vitrella brassicaformis CCMP3155]
MLFERHDRTVAVPSRRRGRELPHSWAVHHHNDADMRHALGHLRQTLQSLMGAYLHHSNARRIIIVLGVCLAFYPLWKGVLRQYLEALLGKLVTKLMRSYKVKNMPKRVILVRHAESEGNVNAEVYTVTPDHLINLTPRGWEQAREAGRALRRIVCPVPLPSSATSSRSPSPATRTPKPPIAPPPSPPPSPPLPWPLSLIMPSAPRKESVKIYCSPYARAQQTISGMMESFVDYNYIPTRTHSHPPDFCLNNAFADGDRDRDRGDRERERERTEPHSTGPLPGHGGARRSRTPTKRTSTARERARHDRGEPASDDEESGGMECQTEMEGATATRVRSKARTKALPSQKERTDALMSSPMMRRPRGGMNRRRLAFPRQHVSGAAASVNDEASISVSEEPRLREQEFGFGKPLSQLREESAYRSICGHFYYRFPGGESGSDVFDRVSAFVEKLHRHFQHECCAENIVIVSHGLTIRLLLMRLLHWRVDEFHMMDNLHNGEIILLERTQPNGDLKPAHPLRWRTFKPPASRVIRPPLPPSAGRDQSRRATANDPRCSRTLSAPDIHSQEVPTDSTQLKDERKQNSRDIGAEERAAPATAATPAAAPDQQANEEPTAPPAPAAQAGGVMDGQLESSRQEEQEQPSASPLVDEHEQEQPSDHHHPPEPPSHTDEHEQGREAGRDGAHASIGGSSSFSSSLSLTILTAPTAPWKMATMPASASQPRSPSRAQTDGSEGREGEGEGDAGEAGEPG